MTQQQIIKSLSDLLLKSERSVDGQIGKSSKYLARIGAFIQAIQNHEDSSSMRYTDTTGNLFRFFHREVIKTVGTEEEEEDDHTTTRDVISAYVSTVVSVVGSEGPEQAELGQSKWIQ